MKYLMFILMMAALISCKKDKSTVCKIVKFDGGGYGFSSTRVYDGKGRLSAINYVNGAVETITYNDKNKVTSRVFDKAGLVRYEYHYFYNNQSLLESRFEVDHEQSNGFDTMRFEYSYPNNSIAEMYTTDQNGNTEKRELKFDSNGNVSEVLIYKGVGGNLEIFTKNEYTYSNFHNVYRNDYPGISYWSPLPKNAYDTQKVTAFNNGVQVDSDFTIYTHTANEFGYVTKTSVSNGDGYHLYDYLYEYECQ